MLNEPDFLRGIVEGAFAVWDKVKEEVFKNGLEEITAA